MERRVLDRYLRDRVKIFRVDSDEVVEHRKNLELKLSVLDRHPGICRSLVPKEH